MRRIAGSLVLLAVLGGCSSNRHSRCGGYQSCARPMSGSQESESAPMSEPVRHHSPYQPSRPMLLPPPPKPAMVKASEPAPVVPAISKTAVLTPPPIPSPRPERLIPRPKAAPDEHLIPLPKIVVGSSAPEVPAVEMKPRAVEPRKEVVKEPQVAVIEISPPLLAPAKLASPPSPRQAAEPKSESNVQRVANLTIPEKATRPAPAPQTKVRLFNSKQIVINFELKEASSSVGSGVELWFTQDRQTWEKAVFDSQARSPYVIEVDEEGLYGFTVIAREHAGAGQPAPQPGDQPQIWTEVDMTRPEVHLLGIDKEITSDGGRLHITWKASDKNLAARPITLLWADQPEGPWKPVVTNMANLGHYSWTVPEGLPKHVHVRVEASDEAGNTGTSQTNPVPLVLDHPTAKIVGVETRKQLVKKPKLALTPVTLELDEVPSLDLQPPPKKKDLPDQSPAMPMILESEGN